MTTKNGTRWIYLQDMVSQAMICNLETLKLATIYPTHVQGGAKIGLRGFLLEDLGGGQYRETGEQQFPLDEEIFDLMLGNFKPVNHWNYDYPNWGGDQTFPPEQIEAVKARLVKEMSTSGMKFDCVLQPRSLLYFTDGDYNSQQRFEALIPKPNGLPYLRDGSLRRRYRGNWSSLDRDADKAYPKEYAKEVGGTLTPVLYKGPALVCRFTLDDQVIAFEGCRIFLTPEGDFICSDWCQRHDFSSYHSGGINLQMGIYDFKSWVLGPCVSRATQQKVFKPTTGAIKVEQVRDLLKRSPITKVPTLDEALASAKAQIAKTSPVPVGPVDSLPTLVQRAVAKYGVDAPVAQLRTAVMQEAETAFAEQNFTDLVGVPVLVKSSEIYQASGSKPEVVGDRLRLLLQGKCPASLPQGLICVKDANGSCHNHVAFKLATLDLDAVTGRIDQLIEQATYVAPLAVDAGPITAEIIAEAKAKFAAREEDRLALERTQLLLDNVKKAQGLKVEVNPDLLPSVQPMLAIYDHAFGEAELKRLTDEIVQVSWLSGPFEDTPIKYAIREDGKILSATKSPLKGKPDYTEATDDSALATVVNWYFDSFLPAQLQAQAQALTAAKSVTINGESFRCYPVVGGATIISVVDGAVSESVTVRRKTNGHIYQVLDNGTTALLDNGTVKDAAAKYFKEVAA